MHELIACHASFCRSARLSRLQSTQDCLAGELSVHMSSPHMQPYGPFKSLGHLQPKIPFSTLKCRKTSKCGSSSPMELHFSFLAPFFAKVNSPKPILASHCSSTDFLREIWSLNATICRRHIMVCSSVEDDLSDNNVAILSSNSAHFSIWGFTGVDDTYEPPLNCEIVIAPADGECPPPGTMAKQVISYLHENGFLKA